MKINKIFAGIVAGTVALAGFTGCNDEEFLKEHSYNYDDNTFYNTESDITMALNPCYNTVEYLMLGEPHGTHSYAITGMGMDTFSATGSTSTFGNWDINADNGISRHWFDNVYTLVNKANTVIDMIDERSNIVYSTDTKKDELRAEAVFLRGWAYRVLAGMFGNVVILEHRTTEANYGYTPNTRQEVWEFVKSDFTWASEHLPQVARLTGTATKAAADVYLAEVNLALGDFKGAEEAATRVINGTDGSYSIMKTRFGSRKDEATDRYGNTLNPYWDLFRQAWGRDASGNAVKKADIDNPSSAENKEAIWVVQYNYGTYSTGGGGDGWWRVRSLCTEANWLPNVIMGTQTTRSYKVCSDEAGTNPLKNKAGEDSTYTFYFYGDDAATFAPGSAATSAYSPILPNRKLANIAQDTIGGRVAYIGTTCIPVEYVYNAGEFVEDGLWDDPNDFRGSEVMMQKNFYLPGGEGWLQAKKEMYERSKTFPGPGANTEEKKNAYKVNASDTTMLWPRLWKFSDDVHPDFATNGNKAYDVDWYMIRVPEAYLLRAEAYLAQGNTQAAADDINEVRARANAKPCSASDVDIDYILDERTREFFGEEHRMITLNRLSCNPNCGSYVTSKYPTQDALTSNTAYARVQKYGFGFENMANNPRETYVDKYGKTRHRSAFHPWNYQFPIPTQVIQSNNKVEYPQNPGY